MEKVIRAVGTLMLVAVVVLSVLTYAGIFNLSEGIEQIKQGVNKLVTWFIPQKFNVDVKLLVNGSYDAANKVITINSASAGTAVAYINVTLKGAPVEIVLSTDVSGIVVDVQASKAATIVPSLPQAIPTGSGLQINIYATGEGYVTLRIVANAAVSNAHIYLFYRQA